MLVTLIMFFLNFFVYFMCTSVLSVCLPVNNMYAGRQGDQMGARYAWEEILQVTVSCHVGPGNLIWVLSKS